MERRRPAPDEAAFATTTRLQPKSSALKAKVFSCPETPDRSGIRGAFSKQLGTSPPRLNFHSHGSDLALDPSGSPIRPVVANSQRPLVRLNSYEDLHASKLLFVSPIGSSKAKSLRRSMLDGASSVEITESKRMRHQGMSSDDEDDIPVQFRGTQLEERRRAETPDIILHQSSASVPWGPLSRTASRRNSRCASRADSLDMEVAMTNDGDEEEGDEDWYYDSQDIPEFDYTMGPPLGEGNFGVVFKVTCKRTHKVFAIKRSKRKFITMAMKEKAMQETLMWSEICDSPRIVSLYRAWQEHGYLHMQMRYCEEGTLSSYKRGAPLEEGELWPTLRDACSALEHMHSRGFCHNDVKPSNMYISRGRLVLGDFGMMRKIGSLLEEASEDGDSTYIAPEAFDLTGKSDPMSDMFSLGISFYELAAHVDLPISGQPLWQEIRNDKVPDIPTYRVSKQLNALLHYLMQRDPTLRPTAHEVSQHPYALNALKTIPRRAPSSTHLNRPTSAVSYHDGAVTPLMGRSTPLHITRPVDGLSSPFASMVSPSNFSRDSSRSGLLRPAAESAHPPPSFHSIGSSSSLKHNLFAPSAPQTPFYSKK